MTTAQIASDVMIADASRSRPAALTGDLLVGLLVGVGASLIWGFLFAGPLLGGPEPPSPIGGAGILATILGTWFGVGAGFGVVARRRLGHGGRWAVPLAGGLAFLIAMIVGLVFAGAVDSVAGEGGSLPRQVLPLVFTAAFAPYLTGVVAAVTLAIGKVTGVAGTGRRAARAAAVTCVAFIVVALALNLLPGWRVGGGDRAMLKVALAANLVVGIIGGATAIRLLGRGGLGDEIAAETRRASA